MFRMLRRELELLLQMNRSSGILLLEHSHWSLAVRRLYMTTAMTVMLETTSVEPTGLHTLIVHF